MATTVDSNIAQSSTPQLSTMKPSPSPSSTSIRKEDSKSSNLNASAGTALDSKPVAADAVNISFQALQSSSDVKRIEAKAEAKKDETKKDETKKDEVKNKAVGNSDSNVISDGATAKVQFVYNQKGDLITKYLDSSGELIYQVPSKLMLLSQEAELKSKALVDTRA
ncbi:MAG TPA: hypothetical protein HPP97_12375 [Desulfuromonadales bacterium]|nr:hypothetical protein [Desulfuromonadales bacterium]